MPSSIIGSDPKLNSGRKSVVGKLTAHSNIVSLITDIPVEVDLPVIGSLLGSKVSA